MRAYICRECGETFAVGAEHTCRAERRDAIAAAVRAGVEHCREPHFTIMIVDAEMQAVSMGKVLFKTNILRADGHDIFAAFLKAWTDAGVTDDCAC